ncbi:MAG: ABC transporter permease, partial [Leptolyngbyaceae cyanobacterium]
IGLMQTTDQLTSMDMIGVDPLWKVISPRLYVGIVCLPLLSIIFCAIRYRLLTFWGQWLSHCPLLVFKGFA